MRLKPAVREFLREAFLSSLTLAEVVRRKKISASTVNRFWAEEKAAGRLPAVRPHFVVQSGAVPVEVAVLVAAEESFDTVRDDPTLDKDASPIAGPNPTYRHECDALLSALQRHHSEPWRRLQDMPSHVLEMEVGNKKKNMPATPPSASRAQEFTRTADAYIGALMRRKHSSNSVRR